MTCSRVCTSLRQQCADDARPFSPRAKVSSGLCPHSCCLSCSQQRQRRQLVKKVRPTGDVRQPDICVYCGGTPETRDHVPSKVLLDEPFPDDLPAVPACRACNHSFSADEEYLACLLECIVCCTTDPQALQRKKISDALMANPRLRHRIDKAQEGRLNWRPEAASIRNDVLKLAGGTSPLSSFRLLERWASRRSENPLSLQ